MIYDLYVPVCKIIDADRHNLILFDVQLWSSLYLMDGARPGVTMLGLALSDNDNDSDDDNDGAVIRLHSFSWPDTDHWPGGTGAGGDCSEFL